MKRWLTGVVAACVAPVLLGASSCDSTATTGGANAVAATTATGAPATSAPATTIPVSTEPPAAPPGAVSTPAPPPPTQAAASQDPYAAATAAGASAVCADGTWSYSQNRSGTSSHHGGVHWWTGNLGPAGPGAH